MKNGTWRKSRTLHMKVALSIPHTEKIEKFMFAKKVIRQKENGEFQPIHRAGLLNLADYEIVEQYMPKQEGYATITIWLVIITRWTTSAISWSTVA